MNLLTQQTTPEQTDWYPRLNKQQERVQPGPNPPPDGTETQRHLAGAEQRERERERERETERRCRAGKVELSEKNGIIASVVGVAKSRTGRARDCYYICQSVKVRKEPLRPTQTTIKVKKERENSELEQHHLRKP